MDDLFLKMNMDQNNFDGWVSANESIYIIPKVKLNTVKRSFLHECSNVWNIHVLLYDYITYRSSFASMKENLKKCILCRHIN